MISGVARRVLNMGSVVAPPTRCTSVGEVLPDQAARGGWGGQIELVTKTDARVRSPRLRAWRSARAAAVALAALLGACESSSAPVVRPAEVPGFDRSALVDVWSPDDVRSIDRPEFDDARTVSWLSNESPVVVVSVEGRARAYPLAILVRRNVVNDGGLVVVFSPLSGSASAWGATPEREGAPLALSLTFGTAGKLYRSNLVMYDRQTRSLWLQFTGQAVLGELKGARLREVPSVTVAFGDFRASFPGGVVLRRPDGGRYDITPFAGYEGRRAPASSLFSGAADPRRAAMGRVVGVTRGGESRAYPYAALGACGNPAVVTDTLGGHAIVVLWSGRARSVLDAPLMEEGRRVGGSGVFEPKVGNQRLTFETVGGAIRDRETGSTWSLLGRALSGPLAGQSLIPVPHADAFWFAWAAFVPSTGVWAVP